MSWPSWLRRSARSDARPAGASSAGPVDGGHPGPEHPLSDHLTGLGDRLSLKERLEQMVAGAPTSGSRPALILFDLDQFGTVNDRHGRPAGDEVLRVTAARLRKALAGRGTVYRSGGDQFIALLDAVTPEEAITVAEGLRAGVSAPLEIGGAPISVTVAAGVVMLGTQRRADGALRDADITMAGAKMAGGDRVNIFNHDVSAWALARKRDLDGLSIQVDELRLQNRMLAEAMLVDLASGLPNGAALEADHLQLHARRSRSGETYALLCIDIDRFGEYNEHLGAAAGDEALRSVAQSIKDTVRLSDRAYRCGSDEFAVLLPGADGREAVAAAERVRSRVQRLALPHPTSSSKVVTVTIGVVAAGFRHESPKDVLIEATQLLADGKLEGGNRIVWPR